MKFWNLFKKKPVVYSQTISIDGIDIFISSENPEGLLKIKDLFSELIRLHRIIYRFEQSIDDQKTNVIKAMKKTLNFQVTENLNIFRNVTPEDDL